MREVSCRALDIFFRVLRSEKELAKLIEGSRYDVAHLRNKHERIEWSEYAIIARNAGALVGENVLEEMGGSILRSPFLRSIMLPARLLFSPEDFYKWVLSGNGGGKQLFNCVENSFRFVAGNRARLALSIPPSYPRSREFFVITNGSIKNLPLMFGLTPATSTFTETAAGAEFDIQFPTETGAVARIRRLLSNPFLNRAAAKELKETHEELVRRYAELEDYRANLEQKVADRTRELADTVAKLQEAQRTRDLLFANINHEIRTPLSLVLLAVASIQARENISPRARRELESIEHASRRLLRLIDGLLLLAAHQEDRLRLRVATCDFGRLLRALVAAWVPAAESRGIALAYEGPERFPAIADEHAIERVITNLVSNAIKFTPSGGTVSVSLSEMGEEVEIAVRDTGVGLDDEFLTRVFGRFEQGRTAVHAGASGSGIGLSIAKELTEAHGGRIRAENAHRGGSIFRIVLPKHVVVPDAKNAAVPETPMGWLGPDDFGLAPAKQEPRTVYEPANGAPKATILVAEDDPGLQHGIATLLAEEYLVVTAPDGLSALQLARKHRPDLLVSDVGMPGMDGFELTKRFREMEQNRLAPVLLLTAYGEIGERLKGFDAGAVDYVHKPFQPAELKARIRALLQIRALALQLHESEKLATIGALSSGLAHELRNPANGIVNALDPLKEALPPELLAEDTTTGMMLKVIEHCSHNIRHLSRQLLGLRQGDDVDGRNEAFAVVLERTEAIVGEQLSKVEYRRDVRYAGDVWCSPPLLTQVLVNLVENGVHAAGDGGWVRLAAFEEDGTLAVEISDSGPGVPVELREKIFEPFFTTKEPGKGTGLGLTTSRDIARRHGGRLEVRPAGAGGTFFRLELPIRGAESARRAS